MKRIILFALFTLNASLFTVYADDYKILYTNSNDILVDGKKIQVGATFNDKSVITWVKGVDRQAIKAVNTKTNKMCLFVSQSMEKNSLTAREILTANKHLSTHDGFGEGMNLSTAAKLRKSFDEQYDLLDSIIIDAKVELPPSLSLIASYDYGDARVSKTLKVENGQVIIDRQLFNIDGKALQPRDVTLNIDLYNKEDGMYTFIKADVQLLVIPESVQSGE